MWISLCYANHYENFTGGRWWDTRQYRNRRKAIFIHSFIEMTFPGSWRGLLLPCSTVEPVYHPLGKTCYNFLQCKLSRPCTVISLTIPADRFVSSFEHFTMKGFKETLVAWVRVHLQYVVELTTHRPRLRFTYSCCVVRLTTHFAWRARPISLKV